MIKINYLSIAVLISAFIVDVTIADPSIQDLSKRIADHVIKDTNIIINSIENNCKCIQYDCGCCKYIELDTFSLNGSLCANATYLKQEYGFSITVTYNGITIINTTMSAKNPPPICYNFLHFKSCLRVYDIEISKTIIHMCFEVMIKMLLTKEVIPLGCITNEFKLLKKIYKGYPNVLMV